MSGPDPSRPRPGSNAIGSFTIGVSAIGSIPYFDYWQTVISQYANSPILMQLIDNFFQYVDQTVNLDAFFDLLWNIETAEGYGLDVWGRIIGVSRTLNVGIDVVYFGFQESVSPGIYSPGTFGEQSFYSGQDTTNNFDLSDSAYRVLLFAKALSNISDGSIPSINQLLINLFPNRGNAFVQDNLDMTITYVFEFVLSPVEVAIVSTSGVLPKPSGVSYDIDQAPT